MYKGCTNVQIRIPVPDPRSHAGHWTDVEGDGAGGSTTALQRLFQHGPLHSEPVGSKREGCSALAHPYFPPLEILHTAAQGRELTSNRAPCWALHVWFPRSTLTPTLQVLPWPHMRMLDFPSTVEVNGKTLINFQGGQVCPCGKCCDFQG